MDKSESEILEEWDLVSSVYDSEHEKTQADVKTETATEQSETSSDNISETSSNNVPDHHSKVESENNSDASDRPSGVNIDSDQNAQSDSVKATALVTTEVKEIIETDSKAVTNEIGTTEEIEEAATEGDTEEMSEPDTEEITVIETIMYDVKKISDVDSEKNIAANIEKISSSVVKEGSPEKNLEASDTTSKARDDIPAKECLENKASGDIEMTKNSELKTENLDSSLEQPESSASLPGMCPVLTEHETASIESSSSDIDIIDENMEDSVSSTFLHPLSLSISTSIDTSSVLTPSSEDDKNSRIEDIKLTEKSDSYSIKSETHPKVSEVPVEKTVPKQKHYDYQPSSEKKSEKVHKKSPQDRNAPSSIFGAILQFLRNMKCLEWSLLGGVVIGLYLTIVFNEINIFTVLEKDDVVAQMKKMIDDLKYDNKLLKDQMLSEMKNDKKFSSFEHQIKELRKENSRLNHMLYDVAKVLEKQKDAHDKYQKKEDDYLTPFKKEINKLKEQINNLKIDNEDLQKQLVRIRYASYSQGAKDANDDKSNKKKEEVKTGETNSADEIPIDINSLKKWNELISLLSKELGLSLESDPQSKGKSYSESRKNMSWYWKVFLRDFKGTFDEFKANITSKLSDYKKVQENTISDVYKFVKNFFTVEEQNNQKFSSDKSSQWNNFGDFFNDLKDKWSKIKNRIDTSDLKSFFKDFKMSGNDKTPQYESQKSKSPPYEHNERKPTNVHFESERKTTSGHFGSDRKYDKAQKESEDAKWMFERAALRAELRDEKDDEVNWFLKKNKHLAEDDTEENEY